MKPSVKLSPVKALVIVDRREIPWVSHETFADSIGCRPIDVRGLSVEMRDIDETLRAIMEYGPDVLLVEPTPKSPYSLRLVDYVRDKMPHLPMLLLPSMHVAATAERSQGESAATGARPNGGVDRQSSALATISHVIRYAYGRIELQKKLLQMTLKDDLTGLHNRRGFTVLATQQLRWASDMRRHMSLFFADLDDLKWINDRFGHAEGDRAIALVGTSVKRTFRQFDVTARLSGDEFVAMILDEPGRDADAICQRLRMLLTEYASEKCRYNISLSIGVAHFDPDNPATLPELMRQADSAMYEQKRHRRSCLSDRHAPADSQAPTSADGGVKRPSNAGATAAVASNYRLAPIPLGLDAL